MSAPDFKRWLTPPHDEAVLAEIQARILREQDRRSSPARRRAFAFAAIATVAAAAMAAIGFFARPMIVREPEVTAEIPRLLPAYEVRRGAAVPQIVRLLDDSELVVFPGARLELTTPDRVRLVRGRVAFSIVHPRATPFVVDADRSRIRVLGTRFAVELEGAVLSVEVDEGRVEVEAPDAPVRVLEADQKHRWGEPPPEPAPLQPPKLDPRPVKKKIPEIVPPVRSDTSTISSTDRGTTAARLFEEADRARAAGESVRARALLNEILTAHRDDPNAGQAAFQLARILLAAKPVPAADAELAVETLDLALQLGVPATLHEDIRELRFAALSAIGDLARTKSAAREYLKHHPNGRRAKEIRRWAD